MIAYSYSYVALSADPLLIWNYGSMAVFAFIAGIGFWLTFRELDAEEESLNAITDKESLDEHDHVQYKPEKSEKE